MSQGGGRPAVGPHALHIDASVQARTKGQAVCEHTVDKQAVPNLRTAFTPADSC